MKTTLMTRWLLVALMFSSGAIAQTDTQPHDKQVSNTNVNKPTYVDEYQAITEVLNKYIEGCKQAKSSVMKPAFNEHATMYSVGADGKLTGGAITTLFKGIDEDFRPSPNAQAAITRIEIVGTAASARIDANGMSGLSFTDFFQLLKVEGKWTVISKIFQAHASLQDS